jgi:exodeoxyribonuclease VII small subunit
MATEWTFEKAMTRLEQIVAALESGRCTLDDSLKLFEEGTKLTAYCSKLLKEAEQKIVKLTAEDADGPELSDRQGEDMGEELS